LPELRFACSGLHCSGLLDFAGLISPTLQGSGG
jgi:hypothetical protein